jgi:hypothetical protein
MVARCLNKDLLGL